MSFVLTKNDIRGYNHNMKFGLVADIIVAIFIIVNLVICSHRGFIRCVMSSISSILAFAAAIFAAKPLADFVQNKFGWETAIATWHIPFVSARTILCLLMGIAVFVVVRVLCIILDKILQALKEKLKAVGVIDHILGTVFGLFMAMVELTFVFLLINQFGLASTLSLTADGGGYFAYRLYEFCRDYLFDIYINVASAASDLTPKM